MNQCFCWHLDELCISKKNKCSTIKSLLIKIVPQQYALFAVIIGVLYYSLYITFL